jgi:hypothetical protein
MIQKIGTIGRYGGPLLVDRILTNSITVAVGDSVRTASGFAVLGTTGARVLGHVESLIGADGLTPVKDGTYLANIGEAYAVASNNQTVAKVSARIDIDQNSLYSAELDAAIGTTSAAGGSGAAGKTFDLADEETLDESTSAETKQQYYSHGTDRNNTANVVVSIMESEVFGF